MLKISKFLLTLAVIGLSLPTQAQLGDKVVAVVDDDVILQSELDERMEVIRGQIAAGTLPANIPPAELQKQVIDQLIMENLQTQLAIRSGIRIDDNRLNQALDQIAQQNGMSFEEFRTRLNQDGQYQTVREQVRKEMMLSSLQNGSINQRITISRQEIENYLRSQSAQTDIAPEYRVQHILVPVENPAQNELQKELADLLYQQLLDGEDIMALASSRQILGLPVSGGDLAGWRKVESLPTPFRPIVPSLSSGDISQPFTSDSGFHIVKLIDKRGGVDLQINQSHLRHLLIRPNEIRTPEQTETLIHELYLRIQNGEELADLARVYTDDPSSMVSGGDLSWVTEGQLPPQFENVVNQLEIDEISQPFQVDDGWHIAQVLERRIRDVTEDNRRFQAEQILRERKFENELENWMNEIRDTAYIDIKVGASN